MKFPNFGQVERPVILDRVVYVTITLMSGLIIYDGWEQLTLVGFTAVVMGPVLAMFCGHVFSRSLALQVELGRALVLSERLEVARKESRFLLVAVPPLLIGAVLYGLGLSLTTAVQIILWLGVATLGLFAGIAGRRSGFVGWPLARTVIAGLLVCLLVLALQVLLRPQR
jgi:hypothetical protein